MYSSCTNQDYSLWYAGLFSPPLSSCHPVPPFSFEVPRSLFSVPEGFCPADKTLIRGCVDTITLILCPCRCQVSETTSPAGQSPEGCQSPLHIPLGVGKHEGIRKTPIPFVCICVSLLLRKHHAPQFLYLGGQVMHLYPASEKLRIQASEIGLPWGLWKDFSSLAPWFLTSALNPDGTPQANGGGFWTGIISFTTMHLTAG